MSSSWHFTMHIQKWCWGCWKPTPGEIVKFAWHLLPDTELSPFFGEAFEGFSRPGVFRGMALLSLPLNSETSFGKICCNDYGKCTSHRFKHSFLRYVFALIPWSSDVCLVYDFESISLHTDSFLNTLVKVILHGTEQDWLAVGRIVPRLVSSWTVSKDCTLWEALCLWGETIRIRSNQMV